LKWEKESRKLEIQRRRESPAFDAGAEGATAPESLRQPDRLRVEHSEKQPVTIPGSPKEQAVAVPIAP